MPDFNDLQRSSRSGSRLGTGCGLVLVFLCALAAGMLLHVMTLAAGHSLLFQAMVWLPVAALVFFAWRARSVLLHLDRRGDLELVERISEKVSPLLKEKKPPAPEKQGASSQDAPQNDPQDFNASAQEEPEAPPEEPGPP